MAYAENTVTINRPINEVFGYLAHAGDRLTRPPLAIEAHRLARLLTELLPTEPEAWALRALIALHRSRDEARTDGAGNLVTMEHQDRTRWDRALIEEGDRKSVV